jgi:hypothetical protein
VGSLDAAVRAVDVANGIRLAATKIVAFGSCSLDGELDGQVRYLPLR